MNNDTSSIGDNNNDNKDLYFVFEHYRHGSRTPCSDSMAFNQTDLFGFQWTGICELTTIGLLQHYNIGIKNKQRYKGFISSSYDPYEMLIQSTDANRTIISAQSQLAGLFSSNISINSTLAYPPLNTYAQFSKVRSESNKPIVTIPFLSIPIHTVEINNYDVSEETLRFAQEKNCPRNLQYKEDNKKSALVLGFIEEFRVKYEQFIIRVLKREINYKTISAACGAIICEYYEGRDLTLFKENNVDIEQLYKDCIDFGYIKHLEVEMGNKARKTGEIIMGSLMRKIIGWMDKRINKARNKLIKAYNSPKYVIYSGHDTTLSAMQVFMLKAFNIPLRKIPFATSEVFQLRKYNNEYYVEYYYNDDPLLNITYDLFKEIIEKNSWKDDDIRDYCTNYDNKEKIILSLLSIFIIIIVIITSLFTYCCSRIKKFAVRDIQPQ